MICFAASCRLGSIQNASDLEPLRQQLNACLAAAIPADGGISSSGGDPSVPRASDIEISRDEAPLNSVPQNFEDVFSVATTGPSASGGDTIMASAPSVVCKLPVKSKREDAASSGDDARFAVARTGQQSL